MRGHYEGDPAKYRELSELAEWKEKDPIARFTRELKRKKAVSDKDIAVIESDARDLVEQAAQFALDSPLAGAGRSSEPSDGVNGIVDIVSNKTWWMTLKII